LKLLVDNMFPPALGRGLGALFADDHEVVHIKDKFGRGNLTDADWIKALGREGGWGVLSGDLQIAKRRPSRELFLRSGLVGFFPAPAVAKLPFNRLAARLLIVWPTMVALMKTTDRGVYELSISGTKFRQING